MTNKELVKQFIEDFENNIERAYELFDDNITAEWPGSDMKKVEGKEALIKLFENNRHRKPINQQIDELVAEDNKVIAFGKFIILEDDKKQTIYFSDFYQIRAGKIIALKSLLIMEKDN